MEHSLSPSPSQSLEQRQILSPAMQQALHVLQLPTLELGQWLKTQIEQNPLLESSEALEPEEEDRPLHLEEELDFEKSGFEVLEGLDDTFQLEVFSDDQPPSDKRTPLEALFSYPPTLQEHLIDQAKQTFHSQEELHLAEQIIGHLDQKGQLTDCPEQIAPNASRELLEKVLKTLYSFDPPGIFARDMQHSLLLQLEIRGKRNSFAYLLIEKHFDDLLHNRLGFLQKKCHCSLRTLYQTIREEIAPLSPHPASRFLGTPAQYITPDLTIEKKEEGWSIEIHEESLPQFRISPLYLPSLEDASLPKEERAFLRRQMVSGKWLTQIVERRRKILRDLALCLIKKQGEYLCGKERSLVPMTMQEITKELQIHESTLARAVAHKHLSCAQGVVPLRSFFTHRITTSSGQEISNDTVKQLLLRLVAEEDKTRPLSDQALSAKIVKLGVPCARRTITKYRQLLQIPSASHRKVFFEG